VSFSNDVRKEISQPVDLADERIFARRCFIEGGTISNPEKSYHMAFKLSAHCAAKLTEILTTFGLNPKTLVKGDHNIVYLKGAEEISDTLKIMDASKSLLSFENRRVEKDLRNNLNRQVNFEAANLEKTVTAAQAQIDAIEYIYHKKRMNELSKPLRDVAKLRQANDTASLAEIGAMLTPPISKSGVNHRLRKIVEIAKDMKELKF